MSPPAVDDDLFRAVFEGSLDALVLADDDGTYIDANAAAEELFGMARAELLGRSISAFAPDEFDVDAAWKRFLSDGEMSGTFDVTRPDGTVRTVEFAAAADVVPGVHLSTLRDVSDRETQRAELEQKTELLTQVFETSPVGIVVLDADGEIIEANRRAERIFGLGRSTLLERPYNAPEWRIIDENGEAIADESLPFARVLRTGAPVYDDQHGIEHADGSSVWLSVSAAPVYEGDTISAVVAAVEDVTSRKESERMLEMQNERLETYSAMVSHDLRSPLSVAMGWIDIAIEDESTADLPKAKAALERMDQLITDLRTLAREGQTVRGLEPVDLEATARAAWNSTETGESTLVLGDGLQTVQADPSRLQQLFENLFRNTIEHGSTDGSAVTVRVGAVANGFYVEDDGPGIPESKRGSVFEYGYSTRDGGTGLGLAIVKAIAEAHGWTVRLLDADPQGARFEFIPRWHPEHDDD